MESMFGLSKAEIDSQKNSFFEKKTQENASRPDGLPPSQGGRYIGFGSTPADSVNKEQSSGWESALSSFSYGWNSFASTAAQLAKQATDEAVKIGGAVNESVLKPTANKATELGNSVNKNLKKVSYKVQDGTLVEDLSTSMSGLASKVKTAGTQGWFNVQSYFTSNTASADIPQKPIESNENSMQQNEVDEWHWDHEETTNALDDDLKDSKVFKRNDDGWDDGEWLDVSSWNNEGWSTSANTYTKSNRTYKKGD